MSGELQTPYNPSSADTASQDSRAPLLSSTRETQGTNPVEESISNSEDKSRTQEHFRLSKNPEDESKSKLRSAAISPLTAAQLGVVGGLRPVSPLASASSIRSAGSPPRGLPYGSPASPGRPYPTASPRRLSPSTSQIFERSVQEDVVPAQASPQIPSHIITENHIPPALDASSEAITNSKLDPDTVEIVTHAHHQPAAANITGATELPVAAPTHEEFLSHISRHDTDNVSNYGSLDVGDVRRLSFISFADVVHAEQELEEQRRDSTQIQSLGAHPALVAPRSPSPIRSPDSSQALGTSPPTSVPPSIRGNEVSPTRGVRAAGSPLPGQSSPFAAAELNIETMRQALRKTGSGDLSGFRSASTSAVGIDN